MTGKVSNEKGFTGTMHFLINHDLFITTAWLTCRVSRYQDTPSCLPISQGRKSEVSTPGMLLQWMASHITVTLRGLLEE